jgi:DNA-binding beta-propeller fold protein YncE
MAKKSKTSSDSKGSGVGRVFILLLGIASFGILAYLLVEVAYQFVVPPPAHRLLFVQDIPLPSGLGPTSRGQKNPLAPGVALDFDGFDFQAYDPPTHRLFVAHTGPNPDLMTLAHTKFDPQYDGHIIVFDTKQDKIIARVNIPQVAGIVIAPDLRKAYAADAQDNIVYAIDVNTLRTTPIQLDDNESPDAMSYDIVDHRIFVSDPGTNADPKNLNVDLKNQNVTVIDALTDKIFKKINLGGLPLLPGENVKSFANAPKVKVTQIGNIQNIPIYGHDVGHNKYDAGLQRVFVTSQVLGDANIISTSDNPNPLPPPGTGELIAIDPVNATIVQRIVLPASCSTPHGMDIDTDQQVAFIACNDFDSASNLFQNLLRVDLRTMTVIPTVPVDARLAGGPDIVLIDHSQHVLFVACKGGISVFDEKAGEFKKLGDYVLGKGTHTIAIDEQTQEIFLPQVAGGIPILRIGKYNPNGV